MVNDQADKRAASDTSNQFRKNLGTHAIVRIGTGGSSGWSVAVIFAHLCGLEPPFERIDSRILSDGVSCRCFVVHIVVP